MARWSADYLFSKCPGYKALKMSSYRDVIFCSEVLNARVTRLGNKYWSFIRERFGFKENKSIETQRVMCPASLRRIRHRCCILCYFDNIQVAYANIFCGYDVSMDRSTSRPLPLISIDDHSTEHIWRVAVVSFENILFCTEAFCLRFGKHGTSIKLNAILFSLPSKIVINTTQQLI